MPTSWYQAIPAVIDLVMLDQPKSILDAGVGFGKYGVVLREALDIPFERYEKEDWQIKIDGIEGFAPYRNPIHEYVYSALYYGEIEEVLPSLEEYDTILLIDVLEHFSKQDGLRLLEQLLSKTNTSLIVSTPIQPAPQEEYLGNKLERHQSRWSVVDFCDFDYHFSQVAVGTNGANLFKIYPRKNNSAAKEILQVQKPFTIGYILPHHSLTGGLKMLLEQMKALQKRGHHIKVFFKGEEGSPAVPLWSDFKADEEILVPPLEPLAEHPKTAECDLMAAGWVYQLLEFKGTETKVFYWEQGHESLFGDIPDYDYIPGIRNSLEICYRSGIPILSVSSFVSKVLKAKYGIETPVIPNGIDSTVFKPDRLIEKSGPFTILLVGSPGLRFKGFSDALQVMEAVWQKGIRFQVKWICQQKNGIETKFPIQYYVQPEQSDIVKLYQQSDLLLFTSWYEGFGMPPLEAMACGTPVIATNSGGVQEYALDGYNCLVNEPGDIQGLAESVIKLFENAELRERLSINGRETALKFSFQTIIPRLETCMRAIIDSSMEKQQNPIP